MKHRRRLPLIVYGTMIPLVLFYLVFLWFPIGFALYLSLHDWNVVSVSKPWVGLGNYQKALDNRTFRISMYNSFYFAVCNVSLGTALALLFALLMRQVKAFTSFFRTLYFIPVVTSMVACGIVWKFMYQPSFGLFNMMLKALKLPQLDWLNSVKLAMPCIIAMSIWKGLGYRIVLFLAGLQGIPETYYEAARLDGAGGWTMFRNITLPLLKPTTIFVLVTGVIGAFQVFTEVYIMTGGGPVHATRVVALHIYEQSIKLLKMGYGSAMSFLLLAVILTFTVLQLRLMRIDWEL